MFKKFLCVVCSVLFMATLTPLSYAAVEQSSVVQLQSSSEGEITPYADVIVYKFRIYNGVYQYRRWNETRGYWVDPYWIDVPGQ